MLCSLSPVQPALAGSGSPGSLAQVVRICVITNLFTEGTADKLRTVSIYFKLMNCACFIGIDDMNCCMTNEVKDPSCRVL